MTINGKEVNLYAGMVCVEVFTEKALLYPSKGSTMTTASILYGGILNYCAKKELEVPVTFEEVYEEVENKNISGDDFKEAQEFMKIFAESLSFKRKLEEIDALKKKMNESTTEKLPLQSESDQPNTTV